MNHFSVSVRSALATVIALFVITLATLARAQTAESGETVGQPWTGAPGITETVAQIMARAALDGPPTEVEEALPLLGRDRSALPQDPDASLLAPPPITGPGPYAPRSPQPVGLSFLGANLNESGFIPPDTMGDVSPTQIVVFLNGRIKVFSKAGVLGGLNATTNTFFTSVRNNSTTSDPRVVWDRISQRWFLAMINTSVPNRVLIAVSSGATISSASSFTFFQFQQDLTTPAGDTGALADYPSLGVDANALYIGANMFAGGATYNGTTGWVVRKSDLLAGTLTVTTFRQMATAAGAGPYAPRGVTNDDPAATQGYFIGSNNAAFGSLIMRRISTPGGTPTISSNISITTNATSNPVSVPAQGSTTNIEASDDRVYDARIHKNRVTGAQTLWCAHTIQVNTSGTAVTSGGRDAARWYQIQNFTATPTVLQQGTLFDSAASNPRHFIYPSVAMSGQGHMALGCTAAGAAEHLEGVVAGRFSSDALNTIQAPTIAQASSTSYTLTANGRNRWGDYSSTVVDPADDMTVWTFQEYCDATNSWAVRVLQLRAPLPATPSSCSPGSVNQGDSNVSVVLTGTSAASTAFFDPDATFPNHIAALVNGGGVTVNSVSWTDATHVTLNLTVAAGATTGARTITVTNPDGQAATSATGILTIGSGAPVCPTVTGDPASLTRCTGASASFTAAGTGSPTPTFQWRHNSSNIPGAASATFTIASVTTGDAGTYDCVLTNSCGSATTSVATLTVNTQPTVTSQPTSQAACTGGSVTFTTGGAGTPTPNFQWRHNGVNIDGETSASLTINPVGIADQGSYDCLLSNLCGSTPSNSAALTVNTQPGFTSQPSPQTACIGQPFSFSVAATGTPAPTFQWRHNTTPISGATSSTYGGTTTAGDAGSYDCVVTNTCGSTPSSAASLTVNTVPTIDTQPAPTTACIGQSFSFTVAATGATGYQWRKNAADIPGATAATYLSNAAPGDAGTYDCIVSNSCGAVPSSGAALTVNSPPVIGTSPTSQEVCEGVPVTFTVSGSGTPAPTFQWRKGGSNIDGATSSSYSLGAVTPGDAGSYDCVLSNSCGSTPSGAATLTVDSPPVVVDQPADQTACVGGSASFMVSGTGTPTPTFQWRKGGSPIPGATASSLTITPAAVGDQGTYDCVLTNACSSAASAPATLTVNTPVSIGTQPTSQSASIGGTATFTVAATGTPPIAYQWRLNTLNLADDAHITGAQTPTLSISPVAQTDGGSYDCVVSNTCGPLTSSAATLTIGQCGSADFNHDGDLGTDADIEAFFACLGGSCCATCDSADFNGDGDLGTDADIEAFFRVLGGGPC